MNRSRPGRAVDERRKLLAMLLNQVVLLCKQTLKRGEDPLLARQDVGWCRVRSCRCAHHAGNALRC